jgi:outer membrane immunogenic protein
MTTRWVKLLAALGMLVGAAQVADAADLSPAAPVYTKAPIVAPVSRWDGVYAGVNVGGAWGHSDSTTSTVFDPLGYFASTSPPAINAIGGQSIGTSGVTGGVQAGYNQQLGSFVAGIEADIESMSLKGGASASGIYPCCSPAGFTVASNVSMNWLATVRGRLGFAQGDWLFFVTGGAAFSDLKASWSFTDTCGNFAGCNGPGGPNASELASASFNTVGWVLGAGVESKFAQRWSWKAEYLHVDFGSVSATGSITTPGLLPFASRNPFSHSADMTIDIGRVGLNYQF